MRRLNERWEPVAGWEGWYEVSDLGRVKRVRVGRGGNTHIGRILKGRVGAPGYPEVILHRKPERRTVLVPLEVNHIDGDKTNSQAVNLEWVTRSKNHQHALRLGLRAVGERHPNAKLSTAAVTDIRASYKRRSSVVGDLARKYGVRPETIWGVANRKTRSYD